MARRAAITRETRTEERDRSDGGDEGPGQEMLRGGKGTRRDVGQG